MNKTENVKQIQNKCPGPNKRAVLLAHSKRPRRSCACALRRLPRFKQARSIACIFQDTIVLRLVIWYFCKGFDLLQLTFVFYFWLLFLMMMWFFWIFFFFIDDLVIFLMCKSWLKVVFLARWISSLEAYFSEASWAEACACVRDEDCLADFISISLASGIGWFKGRECMFARRHCS